MGRTMLAVVFSLAYFFFKGADSTTFTLKNNCPYTVWPGTLRGGSSPQLSQTGFQLPSGASPISLDAPTGWSGRFWARTQCSTDSSGKFSCLSGDCGSGQVACNGNGGAPPTTLAEFTLQGDGGKDFYDVSLVDGFNVPVSVVPQGGSGNCSSTACAADVNSQCPSGLQVQGQGGSTIGCKSACAAFNTDEYCCRGAYGTPDTCKASTYSMMFKSACPQAYSYAYDDKSSTFTCVGADKSLTLWDVKKGDKIVRITLQYTTFHARLHPGSCTPSVCLACPLSSAPVLVDLNTGTSTKLPDTVSDVGNGAGSHSRNNGPTNFVPIAAEFNKYGDLIYVGNSKGEILIVDYNTNQVQALVPISGASLIKNIVFSRNGQYLLTNSDDRVIRVYENLLPEKGAAEELKEMVRDSNDFQGTEKLKAVGSKCMVLFREFQDVVTKIQWKAPCFSGDGEWIVSASANKGEHKLYIWDRSGYLVKILEGPKEALIDLSWHPLRPLVVSVSGTGFVYIWAKDYTENWSAFAPDFKELEENEEYIEREDEFDLVPENEKVKELEINMDEEVDIMSVEKDSVFSDSDASQEELCFLPAVPLPDVPEKQEKCLVSSSKLEDSNHSIYQFEAGPEQNGQVILPASSPAEVAGNSVAEDTEGTTGSKRKRKPSAKVLELQEEMRKLPTKMRSVGRPPKSKNRFENGDDDSNGDGDEFDDDTSDDYI